MVVPATAAEMVTDFMSSAVWMKSGTVTPPPVPPPVFHTTPASVSHSGPPPVPPPKQPKYPFSFRLSLPHWFLLLAVLLLLNAALLTALLLKPAQEPSSAMDGRDAIQQPEQPEGKPVEEIKPEKQEEETDTIPVEPIPSDIFSFRYDVNDADFRRT
jgi:hypothetical protein